MFSLTIRRLAVNFFKFLSIIIWVPFFFITVWPFIRAAIKLNYINFQTVGYIIYTVLLLLLAIALYLSPRIVNKWVLIHGICYAMAAIIVITAIADLISYKAFIGYRFNDSDAIFVNLVMNSPDWIGVVGCVVLAALYVFFAGALYSERKWLALLVFILIFIVDGIFPIIYSTQVLGIAPRSAWLKKALFILPQQFFIITSLGISATSWDLWSTNI